MTRLNRSPNIIGGGQGRSAEQVKNDALGCFWAVALILAFGVVGGIVLNALF